MPLAVMTEAATYSTVVNNTAVGTEPVEEKAVESPKPGRLTATAIAPMTLMKPMLNEEWNATEAHSTGMKESTAETYPTEDT